MRGHVFHVPHVFVAAFDFEAANARIDQRTQVCALIVVFHRQQMLVERHHAALTVLQRVRQSTFLRTRSAVGAATGVRLADVAIAGERHTQRAMHEKFERHVEVHHCAHLRDLLQREFACEYQLREARITEKLCFCHGANVALRRCMQRNRRNVQLQNAHVLHDQRIDACVVQLVNVFACWLQLGVVQDGVDGDENARAVTMRKLRECCNIGHAVFGFAARAERRAAYVHRIGTVQHRLTPDFAIAGGGQQFKMVTGQSHGWCENKSGLLFSRRMDLQRTSS